MKRAFYFSLFLLVSSLLWSQNKYALVIGNSNYPGIQNVLPNVMNDTQDISQALKGLGFNVELKTNLRRLEMLRTIEAFLNNLENNPNSEGFFWYAGHGCEIEKEVYLMPLDVIFGSHDDIKNSSFQLTLMLERLESINNKINVIVLDSCRAYPVESTPSIIRPTSPSSNNSSPQPEDTSRLHPTSARRIPDNDVPAGLFIIFSASPGYQAYDGAQGKRNSPFAEAFLKNIKSTEPLIIMLGDVNEETYNLTRQRQRPSVNCKLITNTRYSLNNSASPGPVPIPIPTGLRYEINPDGVVITGYSGTAQTLNIPERIENFPVINIAEKAFERNETLKNIAIPSSVTEIGYGAFSKCQNLTSINIPASVIKIGLFPFMYSYNLTNITVDNNNPSFSSFNGVLFDKNRTILIAYPAGKKENTYSIPYTVTSIGSYAFSGSNNITNISITSSVTSIGIGAFYSCTYLSSVNIPSSLTYIADSAFAYCYSLASIIIPSSVTSVGKEAFLDCMKLTNVSISRRTRLENNVFPPTARITYRD